MKARRRAALPSERTAAPPDPAAHRIARRVAGLRGAGRKAFIAYLTAGDPDLDTTVDLVCALDEAGVDIVELGIPYSDPMADGAANQAAAERALKAGASVAGVLEAVHRIRTRSQVPLLFFTYLNPVLAYGAGRFAHDAVAAGVDGILALDLPFEEDRGFLAAMRQAGLATICLAAPTTTPARRKALARESRGFLYYICRLGVTGERATLPADLGARVAELKAVATAPVCNGFGISTPEQAAEAARYGDGVIVGSHLVRLVERHAADPAAAVAAVRDRARELAAAVHGAG